jgi:hypothetical protein
MSVPNDTIYECVYLADIEYAAFGAKGAIYSGRGRILPGQRVGLYPAPEYFTGIDRTAVSAVPDPKIAFEQNWVPEAIRRDTSFNGVILSISSKQLAESFRLVEGENAV